jgi:hypothetical protein
MPRRQHPSRPSKGHPNYHAPRLPAATTLFLPREVISHTVLWVMQRSLAWMLSVLPIEYPERLGLHRHQHCVFPASQAQPPASEAQCSTGTHRLPINSHSLGPVMPHSIGGNSQTTAALTQCHRQRCCPPQTTCLVTSHTVLSLRLRHHTPAGRSHWLYRVHRVCIQVLSKLLPRLALVWHQLTHGPGPVMPPSLAALHRPMLLHFTDRCCCASQTDAAALHRPMLLRFTDRCCCASQTDAAALHRPMLLRFTDRLPGPFTHGRVRVLPKPRWSAQQSTPCPSA